MMTYELDVPLLPRQQVFGVVVLPTVGVVGLPTVGVVEFVPPPPPHPTSTSVVARIVMLERMGVRYFIFYA